MLKGIDFHIEPLMEIEHEFIAKDFLENLPTNNFVITSRHALKTLDNIVDKNRIKLFVVGNFTASKAQEIGFAKPEIIFNNAQEILDNQSLLPKEMIYFCGDKITINLQKELARFSINVINKVVYSTVEKKQLSNETINLFKSDKISDVAFFSSNSALIFNKLMKNHNLYHLTSKCNAFALSDKIAANLEKEFWNLINVCDKPDAQLLANLINERNKR